MALSCLRQSEQCGRSWTRCCCLVKLELVCSWYWLLHYHLISANMCSEETRGILKRLLEFSSEKGCLNERVAVISWILCWLLWLVVRTQSLLLAACCLEWNRYHLSSIKRSTALLIFQSLSTVLI